MKLFPPDPEIKLYETGFGDSDPFNRVETGKSLSSLVERIEDPLVIALDGGWGSGKTWFLKRWVGAHKLENGGNATTVYFDAFAHDRRDLHTDSAESAGGRAHRATPCDSPIMPQI